jgi:branched-chain amino acid transport system substrate-binding protein
MSKHVLASVLFLFSVAWANAESLKIYLDADRQANFASARSIEIGVRAAFDEVGDQIQGFRVEFVPLDHRANSRRAQKHLERFANDPEAIAVIGGLHSPPYLQAKAYVNENGIPLLLPWSAAAPLTRSRNGSNSIFRVSLDDSKAAEILANNVLSDERCQHISILLWESGWGRSNERTLTRALVKRRFDKFQVLFFSGNLKEPDAISLASQVAAAASDCVIFVGNAPEGATILNTFFASGTTPKVFSHWGISGGTFEKKVNHSVRSALDLTFIQPCFDFDGSTPHAAQRLRRIRASFIEDFDGEGYLSAPAGMFHGFDLGVLLIEALQKIDLSLEAGARRLALVQALENIEGPVVGLLRSYERPFADPSHGEDAHEALELQDFCMAQFDSNDKIVPMARGF